jgi:hypothetical protein
MNPTPLVATVILNIPDFTTTSPGNFAPIKFNMKLGPNSFEGASIDNSTSGPTIRFTAPKGQPIQLNFQLGECRSWCQLLGLGFQEMTKGVRAGGGFGAAAHSEFPAILGSRDEVIFGCIASPSNLVFYSIPPNTMSVIDLNLANLETVTYSFVAMVQGYNEIGEAIIGIIDPDIINEPGQ